MTQDESVSVHCVVNGQEWDGAVASSSVLLDFLRDHLGLKGAKRGCEWMTCGACTVLVDDMPMSACGMLTADVHGAEVRTVESLSLDGKLSPLQQAFVDTVGSQCGFCTPGQLMSATALVEAGAGAGAVVSRAEVDTWMKGNLCRCGGYVGILEAIERVLGSASPDRLTGDRDLEGPHGR